MTAIKTRWVLTDDFEIHPTTITGKQIAQTQKDENEFLHEVLDPILEEHNWKWRTHYNGNVLHNREYLDNELHKQ